MPFDGNSYPTIARRMMALFGDDGKHWIKGSRQLGDNFCLIGAFVHTHGKHPQYASVYAEQLPGFGLLASSVLRQLDLLDLHIDLTWHESTRIQQYNDAFAQWRDIRKILEDMHAAELEALSTVS